MDEPMGWQKNRNRQKNPQKLFIKIFVWLSRKKFSNRDVTFSVVYRRRRRRCLRRLWSDALNRRLHSSRTFVGGFIAGARGGSRRVGFASTSTSTPTPTIEKFSACGTTRAKRKGNCFFSAVGRRERENRNESLKAAKFGGIEKWRHLEIGACDLYLA